VDINTISGLMGYDRISALENELLSSDALRRKYGESERHYVVKSRKD
jgi:hypothetical protein